MNCWGNNKFGCPNTLRRMRLDKSAIGYASARLASAWPCLSQCYSREGAWLNLFPNAEAKRDIYLNGVPFKAPWDAFVKATKIWKTKFLIKEISILFDKFMCFLAEVALTFRIKHVFPLIVWTANEKENIFFLKSFKTRS